MQGFVLITILTIAASTVAYGQEAAVESIYSLGHMGPEVQKPVAPGGGLGCVLLKLCEEVPPGIYDIRSGVEALSSDPLGSVSVLGHERQAVSCLTDAPCLEMLQGWAVGVEELIADDPSENFIYSPLTNSAQEQLLLMPDVFGCLNDQACSEGIDALVGEWASER